MNKFQLAATAMLFGFILAAAAQNTWIPSSSPTTVWTAIASSADGARMIAAGYGSGLYLSTDSGHTWTITSSGVPAGYGWTSVASSPDGTNLLAGGFNVGIIYISTNAGASWYAGGAPSGNWQSLFISADASHLVASTAALNGHIYYSTNRGITWIVATAPAALWDGIAGTPDGSILYSSANNYGKLYKSTDYGVNWSLLPNSTADEWVRMACSTNGQFVVAQSSGGGNPAHIYISTNYGTNWAIPPGSPMAYWTGLALSADGSRIILVAADGQGVFSSNDSGATWVADNAPAGLSWNDVAASWDGNQLAGVTYGDFIYINQTTPILAIARSGTNTLLSWPTNQAGGFRLTANQNLTATNWATVTNSVTVIGSTNQVTVPIAGTQGYFRLQNP